MDYVHRDQKEYKRVTRTVYNFILDLKYMGTYHVVKIFDQKFFY